MISMSKAGKRFGSHVALAALDLEVARGEVYALLGANGAGKSTTLNLLLGFLRADSGTVRVDGIDPASTPAEARSRIAYLPEQVALYPTLSGVENLGYFAALSGHALPPIAAGELLRRAGLPLDAHDKPLAGYSKGMRQKVGVAIALAKQASVLLLDEPLSGLDPAAANDVTRLLREVADTGVTVLLATHDLFRARQVADRIGILRHGEKRAELDARALDAGQLEALYLQHMEA
jgi:ABC-2 type transport system ATP-binding protein